MSQADDWKAVLDSMTDERYGEVARSLKPVFDDFVTILLKAKPGTSGLDKMKHAYERIKGLPTAEEQFVATMIFASFLMKLGQFAASPILLQVASPNLPVDLPDELDPTKKPN